MIYPKNFETKIGFSEIRNLLKERCICGLGRKKVEDMTFSAMLTLSTSGCGRFGSSGGYRKRTTISRLIIFMICARR